MIYILNIFDIYIIELLYIDVKHFSLLSGMGQIFPVITGIKGKNNR